MLVDNPAGGFKFIKGIRPFSFGAVASPGHEVVHARFDPMPRLEDGFGAVQRHLKAVGRPLSALCGMELRTPQVLSAKAFGEFNEPYRQHLVDWGLLVGDNISVGRTNVVPQGEAAVTEPRLYGFSYTDKSTEKTPTFMLSGVGEVQFRGDGAFEIAALGDISAAGLARKADCVLDQVSSHLKELGVGWAGATTINVYTVHDLNVLMDSRILPAAGAGVSHGVVWYFTRPPVTDLEFELDLRRVRRELFVAP